MRRAAATLAVATGFVLAVVPALAADEVTVTASGLQFNPPDLTIRVGDTVRFANSGGTHNFAFADGMSYPQTPAGSGDAVWNTLSRTFSAAGQYRYVCDDHEQQGMTGVVNVIADPPAPTPTPAPTPPPDPAAAPPVEVRTLQMAAAGFCTKRSRNCRRPGVRVRIDLSQPAKVTGALTRGKAARFGRVRFGTVPAGMRTLRFTKNAAGRRLTAGRYKLELTIAGKPQRRLGFRVRS